MISMNITSPSSSLEQTNFILEDWGTSPSDSSIEFSFRTCSAVIEANGSGCGCGLELVFPRLSSSSCPSSAVCQKSTIDNSLSVSIVRRSDFESWQQCIYLYCLGKENGENILQSIDEGLFKMATFRETLAEGALHLGLERDRVVPDLTPEEKERYKADIRATNILLQGLPKDIYTLINHYTNAKDIWDNVKMLLEGSELTKDERES
ncbi:hypothetical protein Tco_0347739 [Tanacetum coccineum]